MYKNKVDAINHSDLKINMVATGGGTDFIGEFLSYGGGSATILNYEVPYSMEAHEKYVDRKIDYRFVSERAAYELAKAAYRKGKYDDYDNLLGVSVTASLMKTEGEREGRVNQFYIGVSDGQKVDVYHIIIDKGEFDFRQSQEKYITWALIDILDPRITPQNKFKSVKKTYFHNPVGLTRNKLVRADLPTCFFLGSFNPIHEGHIGIHDILEQRFFDPENIYFERSYNTRGKGNVNMKDIIAITTHDLWKPKYNLIGTEFPLIVDKIGRFRELGFTKIGIAIGIDTWVRFIADLMDDEYNDHRDTLKNVRFYVFNRGNATKFDDHGLNAKFIEDYNINMSSTEIRNKQLTDK